MGGACAAPRPGQPHIGVLLDNTPEYLFWLGAAAVSRSVIVGINATYRGAELARLIDHCDCQVLVTSDTYADLLAGAPSQVDRRPRARHRHDHYARRCSPATTAPRRCGAGRRGRPLPPDLHVGLHRLPEGGALHAGPVRAHGRPRRRRRGSSAPGAAVYAPLPFFHTSSLFTGLASALQASVAVRDAHEVLGVADDARHPPHRRHDADLHGQGPQLHPGGAAVPRRRRVPAAARVRQRGVGVRHPGVRRPLRLRRPRQLRLDRGHSSSSAATRRCRRGALGRAPTTPSRCTTPTPARSARGRGSTPTAASPTPRTRWARSSTPRPATASRATTGTRRRGASKVRDGIYWSGDLAYRDDDGWFFFAGRSNEWLRVDGENFAAAPVERIVLRHPEVRLGGGLRRARRPRRRPGHGRGRGRRTSTRSTSRDSTSSCWRSPTSDPKWVPRFVRSDRRAPQAREHEDRQDPAPPRRLDRTGRLVATRARGTAPAVDADRPRGPGPPASMTASVPSLRVATSEGASATCAPEPSELPPSTWSPGAALQW